MQQQRTLSGLLNCELLCLQEFHFLERFSQELAGYLNDCSA